MNSYRKYSMSFAEVSEWFKSDNFFLAISLRKIHTVRFTSTIMLAKVQRVKKMSNERF